MTPLHGLIAAPMPAALLLQALLFAPVMAHAQTQTDERPASVRPITDDDRAAAFPDVEGHSLRDTAVNYFVLFDQLEWQSASRATDLSWDTKGWVGKDRDRLWFRTEGERSGQRIAGTQTHLLYGRALVRWWDVVVGIRQDVRPGSPQTWAAVGLQGLAPYWFEVEVTGYVGPSGRTQLRVETEYELLVTNRLVLQPLLEMEVHGRADPVRGLGAGLTHLDGGLRLRYEFRREFAPYLGLTWNRKFFGTADRAVASGEPTSRARLAVGVRVWL
jgi:copper resistance protein B